MKLQIIALVSLLCSGLLVGCGDPSVNDVCGKCSGTSRDICEQAYDLCKHNRACDLDDLDKAYDSTCGGSALTEEPDAGF
jgi:hypothetical protein